MLAERLWVHISFVVHSAAAFVQEPVAVVAVLVEAVEMQIGMMYLSG